MMLLDQYYYYIHHDSLFQAHGMSQSVRIITLLIITISLNNFFLKFR